MSVHYQWRVIYTNCANCGFDEFEVRRTYAPMRRVFDHLPLEDGDVCGVVNCKRCRAEREILLRKDYPDPGGFSSAGGISTPLIFARPRATL